MERFYKMVEASNKRFPNGVGPYQMATRLLEEWLQLIIADAMGPTYQFIFKHLHNPHQGLFFRGLRNQPSMKMGC